jgi:hypothetical protein
VIARLSPIRRARQLAGRTSSVASRPRKGEPQGGRALARLVARRHAAGDSERCVFTPLLVTVHADRCRCAENVPACLYIWAFPSDSDSAGAESTPYLLALLSQSAAIEHAAWRPAAASHDGGSGGATLALLAGGAALYLWRREDAQREGTRQRAEAVPVPIGASPSSLTKPADPGSPR